MTTKTEVILQGPDNWTEWNDEFQSKAIAMNLWEYIKENPKQLLEEPVQPKPENYKTIETPTTSSSTQPAIEQPTAQPSQTVELTTEENRNFQTAWNIYALNLKRYDA
jgi:hypothetical protein